MAEAKMITASNWKSARPFGFTALGWLALSLAVCTLFPPKHVELRQAIVWLAVIWAVALVDLLALAKLIQAVFALAGGGDWSPMPAIQTFYWGLIKLACLGLFGAILLRDAAVPASGLLLGLATLFVVPIVGGFIWGQRIQGSVNHA
jgi:hypothetical protein